MMIAVFRKEMRDHLRDRSAVTTVAAFIVLVPLLLAAMFAAVAGREAVLADLPTLHVEHGAGAPDLVGYLHARGYDIAPAPPGLADAVRRGEVELALRIGADHADDFAAGRSALVEVLVDDSRHRRQADQLMAAIRAYAGEIGAMRLVLRGLSPDLARPLDLQRRDFSTPAHRAAQLLGTLVIFLMVMPFMASMGVATDALAGERERRSLELLLAQPVAPGHAVAGKWLAASVFGLGGLGLMLALSGWALPRADLAAIGMQVALPATILAGLMLAIAPLALLAAAVQLGLSLLAKSYKEAQFYMSMLMFVPMGVAFMVEFRDAAPPAWAASAPVVAQQALVAALLRGDWPAPADWAVGTLVTLAATLLVVHATARRLAHMR